jgi:HigB_toxin, RelE-like toxic component of a toxin-antitoxin system
VRILSHSTLRNFWEIHPDAEEALKTWHSEASNADWQSSLDVKTFRRNVSIIANDRVVFDVRGCLRSRKALTGYSLSIDKPTGLDWSYFTPKYNLFADRVG